ncbi:MAG: hypothetical protein NZO58_05650 [Gemmataceae bacterium]|nr:hypothetical protein [Gemmataceae bacterium]
MDKKPTVDVEALARQLQDRLRRARPRWLRWLPLLVAFVGTVLVTIWIAYPAPERPRVTLTALDTLVTDGGGVAVYAYFDPESPDEPRSGLNGLDARFTLNRAETGPGKAPPTSATSDRTGRLTGALDIGEAVKSVYVVRQQSPLKHQAPQRDMAAIHRFTADAPLLLVDAETTLADLDPQLWSKTNVLEIPLRAGAGEALRAIQSKTKMTIVYFAVGLTPAREYRRVRDWIGLKAAEAQGLPDGPVLGRLHYDGGTVTEARAELLDDLRRRFTGPITAVVRGADAAEQCLARAIRVVATGGGDFPAGTIVIKNWQELPAILGR